jgi:predicted TIM-barrel fold metal-dependent hydrolase
VWGLDWPHVNLERKRSDRDLAELLPMVTHNEDLLKKALTHNPAVLYDFGFGEER